MSKKNQTKWSFGDFELISFDHFKSFWTLVTLQSEILSKLERLKVLIEKHFGVKLVRKNQSVKG